MAGFKPGGACTKSASKFVATVKQNRLRELEEVWVRDKRFTLKDS